MEGESNSKEPVEKDHGRGMMKQLKVYSAAPLLYTWPKTEFSSMNWLTNNGELMECEGDNTPPVMRSDFDDTILGLPDRFTGFNLEPSAGCWKFVNGLAYPDEAAEVFESVAQRIMRSDLILTLFSTPCHSQLHM